VLSVLAAVSLGLSFGGGAAHGFLGPQLELRLDHVVLSWGAGLIDVPFPDAPSGSVGGVQAGLYPAGGIRYLFGDGEGPYVSLHVAYFSTTAYGSARDFETRERAAFGATGGMRFRPSGRLFVDLGLGIAVQWVRDSGVREKPPSGPGFESFVQDRWQFGFIRNFPFPDFDLAIGFEF
jgi:hypothetical protein